ncbi:hypothetical protein ABPG72_016993 [Tetrahymena utriculariae]
MVSKDIELKIEDVQPREQGQAILFTPQKSEKQLNRNNKCQSVNENAELKESEAIEKTYTNFQKIVQAYIEMKNYNGAWDNSSVIQKILMKIRYKQQFSLFKWPIIYDQDNYRYVHRTNVKEKKSYYSCEMFQSNCHGTCTVDLESNCVKFIGVISYINTIYDLQLEFKKQHSEIEHKSQNKNKIAIDQVDTPQKFLKIAKRLATENANFTSQQIYETILSSNNHRNIIFPTKQEVAKVINNVRGYHNMNIKDLEQILSFKTKSSTFFCHEVKALKIGKIAHFASQFQLRLLANQEDKQYFIDGFRKCPNGWHQLLTIVIKDEQSKLFIPVYHILITGQSEELYRQAMKDCKSIVKQQTNQDLQVRTIICDFEKALVNAIKASFPDSDIFGCFFHLSQCLWRKCQKIGLRQRQYMKKTFLLITRLLLLSFQPLIKMKECFLAIQNMYKDEDQLLIQLLEYYDNYWLKEQNCKLEMINYERKLCDLKFFQRSNNCIEAFHSVLSKKLYQSHQPPLLNFLEALTQIEFEKASDFANFNYGFENKKANKEFYSQYFKKIIKQYKKYYKTIQLETFCEEFKLEQIEDITNQFLNNDDEDSNYQIQDKQDNNQSDTHDQSDYKELTQGLISYEEDENISIDQSDRFQQIKRPDHKNILTPQKNKNYQPIYQDQQDLNQNCWKIIINQEVKYIEIPKWRPKYCDCKQFSELKVQKDNKYLFIGCSQFNKGGCKFFRFVPQGKSKKLFRIKF